MSLSEIALSLWLGLSSVQDVKPEQPSCEQIIIENAKKNHPTQYSQASEKEISELVDSQRDNCGCV